MPLREKFFKMFKYCLSLFLYLLLALVRYLVCNTDGLYSYIAPRPRAKYGQLNIIIFLLAFNVKGEGVVKS